MSRRRSMPPQLAARFPLLCCCSSQVLLQLVVAVVLPHFANGFSVSQRDCQVNEQFLKCGTCEGNCRELIITNCRKECKPPRCECQAKLGYVRAHDGACILASECATYKGLYLGRDGGGTVPLASSGDDAAEAKLVAQDGGLPPSIRPPSADKPPVKAQQTLQDQVIQVGPAPPVIIGPTGKGHKVGTSRMNLFADVANARNAESDDDAAEATTVSEAHRPVAVVHSIKHSPQPLDSLLRQSPPAEAARVGRKTDAAMASLGEEEAVGNAKLAKCGERRCSTTTRDSDETSPAKQQLSSKKSNAAYLFAYIARPNGLEQRAPIPKLRSGAIGNALTHQQNEHFGGAETAPGDDGTAEHFVARGQRQIAPLAPHLRIYQQRR